MPHEDGPMNDVSPMGMLDQAIELHQEHIDDPESATPESQQKLMYLLQSMQEMMPKMMKSLPKSESMMPRDETSMPSTPDGGEAANQYSGGNRRYSYAQYRPGK